MTNIVEVRYGSLWKRAEGRLCLFCHRASLVAARHSLPCLSFSCPRFPNLLLRAHSSPSNHARQAFDFYAAHNTPHRVFVFVLCAARRRPPRPADEGAAAKSAAVGAPACVLQKLCGHEDSLLKSIAEFAGVPMRATPRAAHFKAIVTAP